VKRRSENLRIIPVRLLLLPYQSYTFWDVLTPYCVLCTAGTDGSPLLPCDFARGDSFCNVIYELSAIVRQHTFNDSSQGSELLVGPIELGK
jgi:hypothetical protein